MNIIHLLAKLGRTISMSEGRRLVLNGAVRANGQVMDNSFDFKAGDTVQIGKQEPFVLTEKDLA